MGGGYAVFLGLLIFGADDKNFQKIVAKYDNANYAMKDALNKHVDNRRNVKYLNSDKYVNSLHEKYTKYEQDSGGDFSYWEAMKASLSGDWVNKSTRRKWLYHYSREKNNARSAKLDNKSKVNKKPSRKFYSSKKKTRRGKDRTIRYNSDNPFGKKHVNNSNQRGRNRSNRRRQLTISNY